jgi:PAS domain S-box-containing protein
MSYKNNNISTYSVLMTTGSLSVILACGVIVVISWLTASSTPNTYSSWTPGLKPGTAVSLLAAVISLITGVLLFLYTDRLRKFRKGLPDPDDTQVLNNSPEEKGFNKTSGFIGTESKYRYLFENSPMPMMIFDAETLSFFDVSREAVRLFGYSVNEFLDMRLKDLIVSDDVSEIIKYFNRIQDDYLYSAPVRTLKKNGEIIFVEFSSHTVEFGSRKAQLVIANDITIKKLTEDGLKTMNESLEQKVVESTAQLEAANKAKSEFLTNVTHEIRTPMNAILGYSELLGSVVTDQLQTTYLESIRASGRALMSLFNYILDLSKIEADKLELEYEYVDAASFFSEFSNVFSQKISEKRLNFKIDISKDIKGSILIDETRLRQVILNLLGNAVKFTERGGISLRVLSDNHHFVTEGGKEKEVFDLVIEVDDTGVGIPEECQKLIFDSFVQVKNRLNQDGTGLGLAITKRLVMLMKGTIDFISEPGRGSTFTVRIPDLTARIMDENSKFSRKIDPEKIHFEKAVILIADDIENRKYLMDLLRNSTLKILETDNGMNALEMVEKTMPQLVITGLNKSGLNGFKLLEEINSSDKLGHIPVIAYSESVNKELKEKILKSDFAGLLSRPLSMEELYLELMKILKYRIRIATGPDKSLAGSDTVEDIKDLHDLISSLEGEFMNKWKTFELRQPLGEVRDFGSKLGVLGTKHNSGNILSYGEDIVAAADSFNIEGILRLLRQYKGMVGDLKNQGMKIDN